MPAHHAERDGLDAELPDVLIYAEEMQDAGGIGGDLNPGADVLDRGGGF